MSIEPEQSSSMSNVSIVESLDASNGKSIQFGQAGSGGKEIWVPHLNAQFAWLLDHQLDPNKLSDLAINSKVYTGEVASDPTIYDIDGFNNSASTVTALHNRGAKVVCYISAGTFEDWRLDANSFTSAVKGKNLDEWP